MPRCPHPGCPGCPLMGTAYPEQLRTKRDRVARELESALPREALPGIPLPVESPGTEGYRAGAKLALGRAGPRVTLGIYRRGTHQVVDIPACPVHDPRINRAARALRGLLRQAPGLVSPGPGGSGWLRYAAFEVSRARGTVRITLVTRTEEARGTLGALAARLCERVPEASGVVWNVNPSEGNEIFGPGWRVLRGAPDLVERFGEVEVRASPGVFLQANREQAARAYREAVSLVRPRPGDDALDLYCGVGAVALHLAPGVRRVVGIEVSPAAVEDARANARALGLGNASFRAGSAEAELAVLLAEGFRPRLVILNPPRKGADPGVIEALRAAPPRAIAYLSCNPDTLARDLAALCGEGRFRVEAVVPFDFLPHTDHVEVLAVLRGSGGEESSQ